MKALRHLVLLFSLSLLMLTAMLALIRHNTAPSPWIIFSVYSDYYSQHVYWMAIDSDGPPERITTRLIEGSVFAISPDRSWLIFEQTHTHGSYIFRLNIADNRIEQLSPDSAFPAHAWTPDGEWMIFENEFGIFRLHKDGGDMIPIVEGFNSPHFQDFSPDGDWLIFSAAPTPSLDFSESRLFRVHLDNGAVQPIIPTIDAIDDHGPYYQDFVRGWLDDGAWMIVQRDFGELGSYLLRMRPDGSEAELLVSSQNFRLVWLSDDGGTVILSKIDGDMEQESVFRLNVRIKELTFIGDIPYYPLDPRVISPDGQHIALAKYSVTSSDVFRFDLSDGRLHQLISTQQGRIWPYWSPDSNWIVFTQLIIDPRLGELPRLFKMRVDGSDLQALTAPHTDDFEALNLWLPQVDLKWQPFRLVILGIAGAVIAVVPKIKQRRPR